MGGESGKEVISCETLQPVDAHGIAVDGTLVLFHHFGKNKPDGLPAQALGSFLAVKMECEEKMPKASPIEDIKQESNCSKTYVSVDVNKYHRDTKAVRKMISIPAWLAQEAEKRNYSLSKILQEALLGKIDIA